jgi:hypothetical protein
MHPDEVKFRLGRTMGHCPFCKSTHVGLFCGPLPHVTCLNCGADGPLPDRRISKDVYTLQFFAIEKWNQAA